MHLRALFALALVVAATAAGAQTYPDRPIRMVVPWTPGGGVDAMGRIVGAKLNEAWGQAVVIDNKAGATGTIGTDFVAKSAPDGYTLVFGSNSTYVIAPNLFKLPYDPEKDLTPISRVAEVPHLLTVNPAVPAKTVAEFIALAKAKPGEVTFGHGGTGSTPHVAGELFMQQTGVKFLQVPYKGASQNVADTVAGNVQVSFDTVAAVLQFVQAGRLRALAVLGPKRIAALPDVPTIAEAGFPGAEGATWYALFGPANMPPAIVNKLNAEIKKIVHLPDVKAKLDNFGAVETAGASPEEFAAQVKAETVKAGKLLQAAGVQKE